VLPSAITSTLTILLAVPIYFFFTISLSWNLLGAAVAANLAELFSFVVMLGWSIIIVKSAPRGDKVAKSWQGFTTEAFQVPFPYSSLHGSCHQELWLLNAT
jgi:Na+-driven multidrug efflux pump